MYKNVVDKKTKRFLEALVQGNFIRDFYLVDGTALAFQFGHRKSIDLSWFNSKDIDVPKLRNEIAKLGKIKINLEEENTLNLVLNNIKLSFLFYPYKLLFPLLEWKGVKIADYRDIACMKLDAISSRGNKKDFVDLYFILQEISFSSLLKLFNEKYKGTDFNKLHLFKSLNYFVDAEEEPMPIMLKDVNWEEIKNYFQKIIKNESPGGL